MYESACPIYAVSIEGLPPQPVAPTVQSLTCMLYTVHNTKRAWLSCERTLRGRSSPLREGLHLYQLRRMKLAGALIIALISSKFLIFTSGEINNFMPVTKTQYM